MSKNVAILLALICIVAIGLPNAQPTKAESRKFTVTNANQLMDAINNAANGDVIIVKSGTYDTPQDQTIEIRKSISLVGESAASTIINLHPAWVRKGWNYVFPVYDFNDALWITASNVEISGLTISSDGGSISATGSGIQIRNSKIETYLLASGRYQNISQNTITDGIGCYGSFNTIAGNRIVRDGITVDDSSGSSNMIYDNIVADGDGITLLSYGKPYAASEKNSIFNNTVKNCKFGLLVFLAGWQPDGVVYHKYSSENIVYHNNFIDNDRQVSFYQYNRSWIIEYSGFLDNGIDGNYWSDYAGSDENGDGIGDSPNVINVNNTDRYPLMYPWGAPTVSAYILENATYGYLPLLFSVTFSVDKQASWMGYSLDGQDNVTISGNTTLKGLSSGLHNITVYALDAYGVSDASETFHFNIAEEPKKEPFPITIVAAASAATVAVVGVGLLVYFKKRKR